MRRITGICLALSAGWLLAWVASARAAEAEWRLDAAAVRVGDPIVAELVVTHDPGHSPRWHDVTVSFRDMKPASVTEAPGVPLGDGRVRSVRRYVLHVDLPGEYVLPAVDILLEGGGRVRAEGVKLRVVGAFDPAHPPAGPDPPKGPVGISLSWGRYVGAALGLAALAGLLAFLWRRFRPARAPQEAAPPPSPPRPAHEVALEDLARLDPDAMPASEFFDALSDVTRAYLHSRYGIAALQQATPETVAVLKRVNGRGLDGVGSWLEAWDLVKFARRRPEVGEARAALEGVRAWVLETRVPGPEEAP